MSFASDAKLLLETKQVANLATAMTLLENTPLVTTLGSCKLLPPMSTINGITFGVQNAITLGFLNL